MIVSYTEGHDEQAAELMVPGNVEKKILIRFQISLMISFKVAEM